MTARVENIRRQYSALASQLKNGDDCDFSLLDDIQKDLDLLWDEMTEEFTEPEYWEMGSRGLFEALCESNSFNQSLSDEVDKLKKKNHIITQKLEEQKKKIEQLEEKLKQMEGNKFLLMLGQVAYDVDRKITRKVLNQIVPPEEHISTIRDMEAAISGRDHHDVFAR